MSTDGSASKIHYEIFKKYLSQENENTEVLHMGKTIIVGNPVLYIVHKKRTKTKTGNNQTNLHSSRLEAIQLSKPVGLLQAWPFNWTWYC